MRQNRAHMNETDTEWQKWIFFVVVDFSEEQRAIKMEFWKKMFVEEASNNIFEWQLFFSRAVRDRSTRSLIAGASLFCLFLFFILI